MIVTGVAICETGHIQGDYPIMSEMHDDVMGRQIGEIYMVKDCASGVQGFTMNGCEYHQINLVLKYFTTHLGCPTKINPGRGNGSDAPTEASTGSTAGHDLIASRLALQTCFATERRDLENLAGGRLETAMAQILSVRSSAILE